MVKIEIDGHPLALYPGQKIRFKMRNPMMYEDVLPKYYTFPFTIPLEVGKNSFLLNYPQLWKNKQRLSGSIDCNVYLFGQSNPRRSVMTFNTVTENSAEVSIVVDKNVDDIGDKNLRELDMGKIYFTDDVSKTVKLRVIRDNDTYLSSFLVVLVINGVNITSLFNFIDYPDLRTYYSNLVASINSAGAGVTASFYTGASYDLDRLIITSSTPGVDNFFTLDNLKTQIETHNVYYWKVEDETSYIHDHLINIRNGVTAIQSNYDTMEFPVTFPVIENIAFLEDDYYEGFQNSKYCEATFSKEIFRFITPMPHLYYVIKKVFESLGFEAFGSFLTDPSIKRFILYSNVAADKWVYFFGNPIDTNFDDKVDSYDFDKETNIHNPVINIASHCPDITVKEFLTEIRKLFNLTYKYDYSSKKVEIFITQNRIDYGLQNAPDFTKNIVNKWLLQNPASKLETIKLFKFEEDSSDGKQKQLGTLDYQQPLIIDEKATKEIVPKVSSICEEKIEGYIETAAVQISGCYKEQGTVTKLKLLQYFNEPNGPTGGGGGILAPDWAKIWFSPGDMIVPFALNKDSYTYFDYVSDWSLRWDTAKGFYEQCWKKQTAILNSGSQLKIAMTFTAAELAIMDKIPYHNLDGSIAIWKDIDVELSENDNSQAECIYQLL